MINLIKVDSKLHSAWKELWAIQHVAQTATAQGLLPTETVHLQSHFPASGLGALSLLYVQCCLGREIKGRAHKHTCASSCLAWSELPGWQRMLVGSFQSKTKNSLSSFVFLFQELLFYWSPQVYQVPWSWVNPAKCIWAPDTQMSLKFRTMP